MIQVIVHIPCVNVVKAKTKICDSYLENPDECKNNNNCSWTCPQYTDSCLNFSNDLDECEKYYARL